MPTIRYIETWASEDEERAGHALQYATTNKAFADYLYSRRGDVFVKMGNVEFKVSKRSVYDQCMLDPEMPQWVYDLEMYNAAGKAEHKFVLALPKDVEFGD